MFWLRALFYLSPLVLAFGGVVLFDRVARLELPTSGEAMTCSIVEPVGPIDPLAPVRGIPREIRDLVFDPSLIRDDDLVLRPHLIASWEPRTVITIRCADEESAGETEAMLWSGEYLGDDETLLAAERIDNVVTIAISGFETGLAERLIDRIDPEVLGDYLLIRIDLRNSIRGSLANFLGQSVEKTQIKMIDYEGDGTAYLFARGDTDLLLRELELYYESNLALDPVIEVVGKQAHTSAQELLVELRQDVFWHDGVPVTARDLVFSHAALTRPDSPLPLGPSFGFVESVELMTDYRLRVVCGEAPATMMERWEKLPVLPAHRFPDGLGMAAWESFVGAPIGFGPYRLERRLADGGVVLLANERYFAGEPLQKRLVYRRFDSLESKLLALRSGRIDTLVPDERFTDWSQRNPGTVRPIRCLPRFQHLVVWNLDRAPFDKNPIRLALAAAVDLDAVLADTPIRYQQPVRSLFFPGMPYVERPLPLPLHDPKGAERLLLEAGYQYDAEKGARVDENGEALAFTLAVNEADSEQIALAGALADQWLGVGVVARIEPLPFREIVANRLVPRDFDAVLLGWEVPLERDRLPTYHSSQIGEGGGNLFGLRNVVVDELCERLRNESDPATVAAVAEEFHGEIAALQPAFFVCESGRIVWTRSRALAMQRPGEKSPSTAEPGVGKAGLERSRQWWVRRDVATETEESGARSDFLPALPPAP